MIDMNEFPKEIDGAQVLEVAIIDTHVVPTGNTIHRVGGTILGPANVLAICQFEKDDQYHLFYCSDQWEVLTDTCHPSLDSAKEQAEFEYDGISTKWKAIV